MKPNIKQFASYLGLSPATVSRAFSRNGRISDATRRRILDEADRFGYHANIHAATLAGGGRQAVGVFFPQWSATEPDYFMSEILLGMGRELRGRHLALESIPFPPGSRDEVELCREQLLSGALSGAVIVAGSVESKELFALAAQAGIPVVSIGRIDAENRNAVRFDNYRGAFLAGKYFRDTGRKFPAYVGGVLDRRKREGFQSVWGEEIPVAFAVGGASADHGIRAMDELLAARPEIDCVLAANDILALGIVRCAHLAGRAIPRDLAVIGFDDVALARSLTPALSSVSLHPGRVGGKAVELLLLRMERDGMEIPAEQVGCELILRETT
ncbi:MAG: LacI family DNA-binding transcriptional regulator [Victivallaceae bacterium]|nr:LacI family DNA-binding transcriptional regulator [Victivallaceae bacterium]